MIRERKSLIYIKHLMLMSRTNKVRIVLTSIGIFVAVAIFAIGLIITNSYYNKRLRVIEEIKENTIAVQYDEKSGAQVAELVNAVGTVPMYDTILSDTKTILSTSVADQRYLNVLATLHGVNQLYTAAPFVSLENNIYIAGQTTLIEGRLLTNADNQEKNCVAVIDEITAQILFPGENALGQTITIGTNINGSTVSDENGVPKQLLKLEVVGIIKSSTVMEEKRLVLKKTLEQTTEHLYFTTQVYCPGNVLSLYFDSEETTNYMVFPFENRDEYEKAVYNIQLMEKSGRNLLLNHSYITYENQKELLEADLFATKTMLNIITLFLCIISGISIMSITFFAIKERIPEIGVRKAFGATKMDIVFQFIFEMVSIAFIASVIATCLAVLSSKVASSYLYNKMYIIFPISVQAQHLILPVLVGVLESVLCSFAPSLYAAKIKVTEALRFE